MPGGSGVGKALFDDVVAYAGFYHPEADTIAATETASLKAADGKLVYDRKVFDDLGSLVSNISYHSGASSVSVFKDAALSHSADSLTDARIVVMTSPGGNGYWYYDLTANVADDVTFTIADGKITATSSLVLPTDKLRICLAAYENGGKMAEIDISDFVTQGGDAVSASLTYNEIYTYKAFVWSEDLNPLNVNCVYSSGY